MKDLTREIDKDLYDIAMEKGNGHIPRDMEMEVFGASVCCGYGLYSSRVREKDGKYYLDFTIGDSCD